MDELLEDCQLTQYRDTFARDLTNGYLRRLTLAMALIGRPPLVCLDNPLSGIDPHNKPALEKTILKYTEGRALIVATRDVDLAERIGQKIAIMNHGKFQAIGSVSSIIGDHGRGYNLEIAIDTVKLDKMVNDFGFSCDHSTLDSIEEVQSMLSELQTQIFTEGMEVPYDFNDEFTATGLFEHHYKEFEET